MRAWMTGAVAVMAGVLGSVAQAAPAATPERFELVSYCPASLDLQDGTCRLRSAYVGYASLQNSGVGGLKTGLPKWRDGFSPKEIDLGRYLFFDPLLSKDGSVACSSCHDPDKGFADGLPRSRGVGGAEVARNAPTLWNVAFLQKLFWDGRASSLEQQMQGPLYDAHEMGTTPAQLLTNLNGNPTYRRLFAEAYPQARGDISLDQVYRALAGFESSLVSLNSRYDLYAHGMHDALTAKEIEGMNVFRSFVARCAECHTPPLFTNQQIAVIGTPEPKGHAFDVGAEKLSKEPTLRGGFKVPTVRNIALTAPYNHSGGLSDLKETVRFYTLGRGHAVPKDEKLTLHWHIWEPKLTENELDRLVDFLKALTDESFKPVRPARVPSGLKPGAAHP